MVIANAKIHAFIPTDFIVCNLSFHAALAGLFSKISAAWKNRALNPDLQNCME
jgi:hypothetical protein